MLFFIVWLLYSFPKIIDDTITHSRNTTGIVEYILEKENAVLAYGNSGSDNFTAARTTFALIKSAEQIPINK
jgi:hypothetical protein